MLRRTVPSCDARVTGAAVTLHGWDASGQHLRLQLAGCKAKLREDADGTPYVTDNHNYIVDLYFTTPIEDVKVSACMIDVSVYIPATPSPWGNSEWN